MANETSWPFRTYTDDELMDWAHEIATQPDAIRKILSDRQKMRAALTLLQQLGEEGMKPSYDSWLTFHDKVAQIAREALIVRI